MIIGLIVGGVLVGQDLIQAAAIRAQISQIEKYNTAVNTFKAKYGYLPGDMPDPYATQFGFTPRGQYTGEGDGNGMIEGVTSNNPGRNDGAKQAAGETVMFWTDLSQAKLIEGNFTTATPNILPASPITGTNIGNYIPSAKIGKANYIYVVSATNPTMDAGSYMLGINYFTIFAVTKINSGSGCYGCVYGNPNMTVHQAYYIDKKMDDGLPHSGNVMATMIGQYWVTPSWDGGGVSSATCNDTNSGNYTYSISTNANLPNCTLSFRFQ